MKPSEFIKQKRVLNTEFKKEFRDKFCEELDKRFVDRERVAWLKDEIAEREPDYSELMKLIDRAFSITDKGGD